MVPPDKCRMHIKSGAGVSARDTPADMRSCGARGSYAARDEERTARSFIETRKLSSGCSARNARTARKRKKGAQTGVCTPSCYEPRYDVFRERRRAGA